MRNKKQFNANVKNQGFIAILTSILVVIMMVTVGTSVANLIITQQKISSVSTKSLQAYFAADSGIEDAIYRIRGGLSIQDNYSFQLSGTPVDVSLSEVIGGSRTITSQADKSGIIKKIGAVHTFDAEKVEFFFGAQVGNGGMTTANGSRVLGNVFSNGTISGTGEITDNVVISGTLSTIDGITVGGDVKAPNCNNADITGVLYRVSGGSFNDCAATGGEIILADPVDPLPLPITEEQMEIWRTDAANGGTYSGDYLVSTDRSLGPLKINGNLSVVNNMTLTLTGTIWITGNLETNNNTTIRLDNSFYGGSSGVIIIGQPDGSNGIVNIENGTTVLGTGQPSSYLMVLTTSTADPAIVLSNNSTAGVFYASQGFIQMANNSFVKEVTAHGIHLNNNAIVEYETGLADLFFSGGPGGGWTVDSWREVN